MNTRLQVYVKIYSYGNELVIAACDRELLGATIRDPANKITLRVDPVFYGGELRDVEYLIELLSKATSANLIGRNVVEAAIRAGFIHRDAVLKIDDIPAAFFTRI